MPRGHDIFVQLENLIAKIIDYLEGLLQGHLIYVANCWT